MRIPGLSTLSARINVGFAVLIVSFAAVIAVTGGNMYLLSRQIRLIPNGYLELSLLSKDLAEKQRSLSDYLRDELVDEPSRRRVEQKLTQRLKLRTRRLDDAERVLSNLRDRDVPEKHRGSLGVSRNFVKKLKAAITANDAAYNRLIESPPIRKPGASDFDDDSKKEELQALKELRRQEMKIYDDVRSFADHQERLVTMTANLIGSNGAKVRRWTIILGVVAISVSILIAFWVTSSLRPLRRLAFAAQRISRGDYASRIDEKGPSEVADLAHEFNAMGRAIEERERELVRAERLAAVGKMAAMITHEVRNPLSSIGLNTELLEEELTGESLEEARGLCRAINAEIDRLTEITEEYLKFARLPKPKIAPANIGEVISSLAKFERENLATLGVSIAVDVEDDLPMVPVDESQIRQALLNLVRNAAEALSGHGQPGTVSMGAARRDAETVELVVRDDGPGIPKELADKLFDPFVSTKERGTGLGLALTHQIVREHGGIMSVDSAPGEGTTFRVRLPVRAPRT